MTGKDDIGHFLPWSLTALGHSPSHNLIQASREFWERGWGSTGALAFHPIVKQTEASPYSKMEQWVIDKPSPRSRLLTLGPWTFLGDIQATEKGFHTIAGNGCFTNVTSFIPHGVLANDPSLFYTWGNWGSERQDDLEMAGPHSHFPIPTEHILGMWAEPTARVRISPPVLWFPHLQEVWVNHILPRSADEIMIPTTIILCPTTAQPSPTKADRLLLFCQHYWMSELKEV